MRGAGFTLIEVMVALAILAIALGAAIRGVGEQANAVSYLRDRTLADWVAQNQLAEWRITHRWSEPNHTSSGEETQGGITWQWKVTALATPDPRVQRLRVEVARDSRSAPVVTLEGYVGKE